MEIEITTGFLMFWGGIAGAILTGIAAIIYFNLSARKAKKLLKKIDEEDF
ncbi:MAG: hypothetical protein ACI4JZ_10010 [Oscillospiraceae bacterium]